MLHPPIHARPLRWTSMMSAFLVAAAVVAALTSVEAAPEDASWLGKRLGPSPKSSRPKDLYSFGIGELKLGEGIRKTYARFAEHQPGRVRQKFHATKCKLFLGSSVVCAKL